jgi:hypothetical protein
MHPICDTPIAILRSAKTKIPTPSLLTRGWYLRGAINPIFRAANRPPHIIMLDRIIAQTPSGKGASIKYRLRLWRVVDRFFGRAGVVQPHPKPDFDMRPNRR